MNIEQFRQLCLDMPLAVETTPFGEETLVYKAAAPNGALKVFALIGLERPTYALLKCDPETALTLRDHYPDAIEAGWHMNKVHWNGIELEMLPSKMIGAMVVHSHSLIALSGSRNVAVRADLLDELIKAAQI